MFTLKHDIYFNIFLFDVCQKSQNENFLWDIELFADNNIAWLIVASSLTSLNTMKPDWTREANNKVQI